MIKIENLSKSFGAKRAVDGISFSVERGEARVFDPGGSEHSIQIELYSARARDESPMEPFISPNYFGDCHSVFSIRQFKSRLNRRSVMGRGAEPQ